MADWHIGLIDHGLGDGSSNGNRQEGTDANIQSALDQLTAGDILYQEEGTYTQAIKLDIDQASGTYGNEINWFGVDSDGNVQDDSEIVLDGNSAVSACVGVNARTGWHLRNIRMINATGDGLDFAGSIDTTLWLITNCSFSNNGADGIGSFRRMLKAQITNTEFNNNSSDAIDGHSSNNLTVFLYCSAIGNGNYGFYSCPTLIHCLAHDNTLDGINIGAGRIGIINGVSDGNGRDGVVVINSANYGLAIRCTNNGAWGLRSYTIDYYYDFFAFYNNTSGEVTGNVRAGLNNITLTEDGYTDRGSDDFSLVSDGEAVGVQIEIGNLTELNNLAHITSGIPPAYGGGGGRRTILQKHGV